MRLRLLITAIMMLATASWGLEPLQGPAKPAKGGTTTKKTVAKSEASAPVGGANEKATALRPPAGAKVAIVVFEDLQCPDCARAYPLVQDVSKAEKIPVVLHDFPLPMHNWSFQAAVIGRYFDTKSKEIGDAWRAYCYTNQPTISPDNLSQVAQKFAGDHGTTLPFLV